MDEIDSSSSNNNKINDENVSLKVNQSNIEEVEKSTFERAIIEAFKQENAYECIKKLSIAYDEIQFFVKDIKNSNGQNFILNKNLLDKLNRLVERKYFNVNILIGKIFNNLLDTSNFEYLSNNLNLLIEFSNQILNNLDVIKTTNVSLDLEKKCSTFLNYLLHNTKINLDEEQKEILNDLLNSFPSRYSSLSYTNFPNEKDNIIQYCESDELNIKNQGILLLMDKFSNTFSLDEQFDLLLQYGNQIVKSIINKPKIDFKKAYFQLGNFITSLLYSVKFRIKIEENIKKVSNTKSVFLYDKIKEDEKDRENIHLEKSESDYSMNDLSFLKDCLFELTNQKETLIKNENIISICLLILNTLIQYNKLFDLQYVCYIILKKIYFIFPKYRKNIEDLISNNLINLSMFKSTEERMLTIESRQFLHYLLNYGEEDLKNKLNKLIEEKESLINIELEENKKYDEITVEYEYLNFADFNLRIGFPFYCEIDAGGEYQKYIEIENKNSLIYIGIATSAYDINIKLLKYYPNIKCNDNYYDDLTDNGHFIEIYKIERIDCSEIPVKIVLFCKESGIYKLIFDNSFSWFTTKVIRYRLSILKLISQVNNDNIGSDNKDNDKIEVDVQI